MNKAKAINEQYKMLEERKKEINLLYQRTEKLTTSKYDKFLGAQYLYEYMPKVDKLLYNYKEVIKQIDSNLDLLNLKETEYVNMALRCDGPIGELLALVNQKIAELENMLN